MPSLYTPPLRHVAYLIILLFYIFNESNAQSDGDNLELRQRTVDVALGGSIPSNCTDTSCAPIDTSTQGISVGALVGVIIVVVVVIGAVGFAGWWFFVRDKDDFTIQPPPPSRLEGGGGLGGWIQAQKGRFMGTSTAPPPSNNVQSIGSPSSAAAAFPARTFGGTVPVSASSAAYSPPPPRTTSRPNPFDAPMPTSTTAPSPATAAAGGKITVMERFKYFMQNPMPQRNPAWNPRNRSDKPKARIGGGQITKSFPKPVVMDISGPMDVVDDLKQVDVHAGDQSSIEMNTLRAKNSTSLDSEGTAVATTQPKMALRGKDTSAAAAAAATTPAAALSPNGSTPVKTGGTSGGGYGRLGGAFGASKRSSQGYYTKSASRENVTLSPQPSSAMQGRSSSYDDVKTRVSKSTNQPSDELLPAMDAQTFKKASPTSSNEGSKVQLKPSSSSFMDSFNPSKKKNRSQSSLSGQIHPAVAEAINSAANKSRSSMYGPSTAVSWKKPASGSGFIQRRSSGHLASKTSMVSTDMPGPSMGGRGNADLDIAADIFKEAKRQPLASSGRIPDSEHEDDHDDEDMTDETDTGDESDYSSSEYTSSE